MIEHIRKLIQKYAKSGILVDSNLLLLLFVGEIDRSKITTHRRLRKYTPDDYLFLEGILGRFNRILTTPNILTEVSNLSGYSEESLKLKIFMKFSKGMEIFKEHYVMSRDAVKSGNLLKYGLTDLGILQIAQRKKILVITSDFPLYGLLQKHGLDSININHFREYYFF